MSHTTRTIAALLAVSFLSSPVALAKGGKHHSACSSAIKSRIDGTFKGWSGKTVFKLKNGQTWQQSSHAYTYHHAHRPRVTISPTGGRCTLKVDGVPETISVRRIK